MNIKKLVLGLAIICPATQASLAEQFSRLSLNQVPARGTMLTRDQNGFDSTPISIVLYSNGTARAKTVIDNKKLYVERSIFKQLLCSPELSFWQKITLCSAIEEAFIASGFRADKKEIKNKYPNEHSHWIKPPNKVH